MQEVFTIEADEEGSACSNTTKGAAREETGMSYQEKGTGRRKKAKESRGR